MALRASRIALLSSLSRPQLKPFFSEAFVVRYSQFNRRTLSIGSRTGIRKPCAASIIFHLRSSSSGRLPAKELRIVRSLHTAPLPQTKSRALRWFYRACAYFGFLVAVGSVSVLAFFIYDASTYRENPAIDGDLPVSSIALNPRCGGPKNLPIAEHFVDDDDSPQKHNQKHKPKLVILGTGWGSIALLKTLNPEDYHVTVISPSNHFLFTPMLPSATVGTLELRSLVEPVRKIVSRVHGHFIKGMAEDVDFSEKLIEVAAYAPDGSKQSFYVPYDKLIIGVGKYLGFE